MIFRPAIYISIHWFGAAVGLIWFDAAAAKLLQMTDSLDLTMVSPVDGAL